ncbi:MAG: CapA family protein [bacterium]|nr:CapA family protein [bacterium]
MPRNNINWEEGSWQAPGKAGAGAEIMITADWAPIRDFDSLISESPESVYGDLLPELKKADLRITNLECPLTDTGDGIWKSGSVLKGMDRHVGGVSAVPFEVVTMANNHVFDYGLDAFNNTGSLLTQNNIAAVGAGLSTEEAEKPLVVNINNLKIGIINFSEGEDLTDTGDGEGPGVFGWHIDRVCELTAELKKEVNAVIVICHGGLEYIPFPPPYIANAFQRVADAGADLVVGHHPHVPQGMQIYKGVPLCYSLGNFVFFQQTDLFYRKIGYMVKAGISQEGLSAIRLLPYEILPDRLSLLKENKLKKFMETFRLISEPLDANSGILDAWNAFLKYYGTEGFRKEIGSIMTRFDEELQKGAAMFRNRMTTLQHRHHLIDLMTRIMEGTLDDAPEWALELTDLWFTKKI